MNEILIIRHYKNNSMIYEVEYDIEIKLNSVSIYKGNEIDGEEFLAGFMLGAKSFLTFFSVQEKSTTI